jgi:hypothetical protein
MKKFTVLVALALLAATGTSYAVTCAYDNVPGATLLVPYFKVSRNGATEGNIPEGGVDTLVALTNVSQWGVIAHITVWNKQSAPVLDFNVPMTGFDVAFFRMKDILNGQLNVNPNTQKLTGGLDPCKNTAFIGNTQARFIRFTHPEAPLGIVSDWGDSIGFYATPAFGGNFRNRIWDSLDESADYMGLVTRPANDVDNPACGVAGNTTFSGDFTGYLTIDVTNYCTNYFPNQYQFYTLDAIATRGWDLNGGPNVLMGDIFFLDPAAAGGNISGDQAIALEFDVRLESSTNNWQTSAYKTFYARYATQTTDYIDPVPAANLNIPVAFQFSGDGREPLGTTYGFRYLNDAAAGLQTWATVWRGDYWDRDNSSTTVLTPAVNLCTVASNGRQISISTWDNDENQNEQTGGGPSGDVPVTNNPYVWWEANRIMISGNSDMNPAGFKGGWTRWTFNRNNPSDRYHQAWVGVQHTAPGAFVSVGHSATLIDHEFLCPYGLGFFNQSGNIAFGYSE